MLCIAVLCIEVLCIGVLCIEVLCIEVLCIGVLCIEVLWCWVAAPVDGRTGPTLGVVKMGSLGLDPVAISLMMVDSF